MMNQKNEIYLLDQDSDSVGSYEGTQIFEMLRKKEIARSSLAWSADLPEWDTVENVVFANLQGMGRAAFVGCCAATFVYFLITGVVLTRVSGGQEHYSLILIVINCVGWATLGICLSFRLANIGLSRWWAIVGALPLLGWYFILIGLFAPRGHACIHIRSKRGKVAFYFLAIGLPFAVLIAFGCLAARD